MALHKFAVRACLGRRILADEEAANEERAKKLRTLDAQLKEATRKVNRVCRQVGIAELVTNGKKADEKN